MFRISSQQKEFVLACIAGGSVRAASRELNIPMETIFSWFRNLHFKAFVREKWDNFSRLKDISLENHLIALDEIFRFRKGGATFLDAQKAGVELAKMMGWAEDKEKEKEKEENKKNETSFRIEIEHGDENSKTAQGTSGGLQLPGKDNPVNGRPAVRKDITSNFSNS